MVRKQEAQTGIITITEMPAWKIEWMLRIMYGEGLGINDTRVNRFPEDQLIAVCEVFELGDFFDIQCLRETAAKWMDNELTCHYQAFKLSLRQFRDGPNPELFDATRQIHWTDLIPGFRRVYELSGPQSKVLRQCCVSYVRRLQYRVLYYEGFFDQLKEDHEFKSEILSAMLRDHRIYYELKNAAGKHIYTTLCSCPEEGWQWVVRLIPDGDEYKYYLCASEKLLDSNNLRTGLAGVFVYPTCRDGGVLDERSGVTTSRSESRGIASAAAAKRSF
ncbi:hypothetical protein BKA67DRAFT_540594 [Truncatella angustata]|uniref:BTB domain-containing protein n=1 Tax=Truncatella angustata TaxID=152316 RepID=A0A9P8RPW8_9PEZI|nr:uncharacterized protein BKA67DRAFT_540594 [Truncatella angustata]KAH6647141.1 hypothetical protein BKA67DRAFT_540594 [Truncatella angustata]